MAAAWCRDKSRCSFVKCPGGAACCAQKEEDRGKGEDPIDVTCKIMVERADGTVEECGKLYHFKRGWRAYAPFQDQRKRILSATTQSPIVCQQRVKVNPNSDTPLPFAWYSWRLNLSHKKDR